MMSVERRKFCGAYGEAMLYISRYVDFAQYGVADTDDGVEEICTLADIKDAVLNCGLDVKGVQVKRGTRPGMRDRLHDVFAYQGTPVSNRLQVKTNMLSCVEVITFGEMITSIRWRSNNIVEPVTIRLSDFGTSCGDRILYGNIEERTHRVTLVFDDKCRVSPRSLECGGLRGHCRVIGELGLGLRLDLREVTDNEYAEMIYLHLFSDPLDLGLFGSMGDAIFDDLERKKAMIDLRNW